VLAHLGLARAYVLQADTAKSPGGKECQKKDLSHQKYHFAHIFPSIASFGLANQSVVKEPLSLLGHA